MTDIQSLLERVEKAEGADRELDAHLLKVWDPSLDVRHNSVWRGEMCCGSLADCLPPLTASLDAALGLVERVDPGFYWRAERRMPADGEPRDRAERPFWATCGLRGEQEAATGATPALALLAALLKALLTTQRERNP